MRREESLENIRLQLGMEDVEQERKEREEEAGVWVLVLADEV